MLVLVLDFSVKPNNTLISGSRRSTFRLHHADTVMTQVLFFLRMHGRYQCKNDYKYMKSLPSRLGQSPSSIFGNTRDNPVGLTWSRA